MWMKVDDSLAQHPKVLSTPLRSMGVWVLAGSWAGRNLSDGYVPPTLLRVLDARKADADALVASGLWEPSPEGGWHFHDWDDWQPSRKRVEADRERARRWRERRYEEGEGA